MPRHDNNEEGVTQQRRFTIPTDALRLLPSVDGGDFVGDCPTEELPPDEAFLWEVSRTDLAWPRRWHRVIGPVLIGSMLAVGVGLYLLQFVHH
jgi:hypothetical protein